MSQPSSPVGQQTPLSSTTPALVPGTTPTVAVGPAKPRDWPVPQIMLFVEKLADDGMGSSGPQPGGNNPIGMAIGRELVARAGKTELLQLAYRSSVWNKPYPYKPGGETDFKHSGFLKTCITYATFHRTHGDDDVGPVLISGYGWAEMIQNVVRLDVVYTQE